GSGMPGRATRNAALDGAWACTEAATTSEMRALRKNAFTGTPGDLVEAERRECVGPRGRARGNGARAPEQLLPDAPGVPARDEIGVRVEHVPQAAVDFLPKLARPPCYVAHVIARLVRRLLDDVVDDRALGGEEQLLHHLYRPGTWRVVDVDDREDRLPQHRTAEEHG